MYVFITHPSKAAQQQMPKTCVKINYTQLPFYFFFCFLASPLGMRDLSSPTRNRTHAPCSRSVES